MLEERYGADVELVPGGGGVFEITVDGKLLFSKKQTGRFPTDEELVQMVIRPTERNLQRFMKLGKRAVAAHEQATPNLGTNLPYPDAQLIHLHYLICAAHALPLPQ